MNRIDLSEMLYYYELGDENEKETILKEFKKMLWGSKCKFKKYKRKYNYTVDKDLIKDRKLIDIFTSHESIEYMVAKGKYKSKLNSIDYIRVKVNNLYGYYCDRDTYYKSEYYKCITVPKNEYIKLVRKIIAEESINIVDIKYKIERSLDEAEMYRKQSTSNKLNITWNDHKNIINGFIEKIFENYKPLEEVEDDSWEIDSVIIDGWNEDNYIISYFSKSLSGYYKNYVRKAAGISKYKEYIYCEACGKLTEKTSNRTKYCHICAKEKKLEKYIRYNKKREITTNRKMHIR